MYSQGNEETYILAALKNYTGLKRFLDIGAWSPTTFSNTRALWETGWTGILVEPSPGPVRELVKEYGNRSNEMLVIAAAMGVERGLLEMQISDDALSSSDPAHLELWKDKGGFIGTLHVPVLTLEDFFYQFSGEFGFISIDTEGTSVDLFKEALRIGVAPECWCVEHNGRHQEIDEACAAHNLNRIYGNAQNVVLEVKR
jgi:FkbM family methyltransferase